MPSRYDDVIRTQQLFVLMCLPGPVLASDWIMPNYNESLHVSLTTAVQSCDLKYCSECVEKGWSPRTQCKDVPGVSQGPHRQCTQRSNSLTPQLEAYWRTICHLPGIQLRVAGSGNSL